MDQISIFEYIGDPRARVYKTNKKIRLIEMFGGIGSQAMALRDLGADFETWKLIEYDKYPVASYNAIHGTNYEPMDIRNVHGRDLEIVDKDSFTYLLTYSFPCQDLSISGLMRGMRKGDSTRSGLLWEVERILTELQAEYLDKPDILLMENVPNVHGAGNMKDFREWIDFLNSLGYSSYWQDLNAKDYGVAQSRNRCFMVSILGQWTYKFPKPLKLQKTMKDYLEPKVDEKYYITNEKAKELIDKLIVNGKILTDRQTDRQTIDLCNGNTINESSTILTRERGMCGVENKESGVCEISRRVE